MRPLVRIQSPRFDRKPLPNSIKSTFRRSEVRIEKPEVMRYCTAKLLGGSHHAATEISSIVSKTCPIRASRRHLVRQLGRRHDVYLGKHGTAESRGVWQGHQGMGSFRASTAGGKRNRAGRHEHQRIAFGLLDPCPAILRQGRRRDVRSRFDPASTSIHEGSLRNNASPRLRATGLEGRSPGNDRSQDHPEVQTQDGRSRSGIEPGEHQQANRQNQAAVFLGRRK